MVIAFHEQEIPWAGHYMERTFHEQDIPWAVHSMDVLCVKEVVTHFYIVSHYINGSLILIHTDIPWKVHFMDRTFHKHDIPWTGHSMDMTLNGQDIPWT